MVVHGTVLNGKSRITDLLFLYLRELTLPFLWLAGAMGDRIEWRGEVFRLQDGRLYKV